MSEPGDYALAYEHILDEISPLMQLLDDDRIALPNIIPIKRRTGRFDEDLSEDQIDFLNEEGEREEFVLQPFVVTRSAERLAKKIGASIAPYDLTRQLNSKIYAKEIAQSLKIPYIRGERCGAEDIRSAVRRGLEKNDSLFLKYEFSEGGVGNFRIDPTTDIGKVMQEFEGYKNGFMFKGDGFVIEPYVEHSHITGVMVHIRDGITADISDQVISGRFDRGNRYPSTARRKQEMLEDSMRAGSALRDMGYEEYVHIDFIETKEGDYYMTEMNARINGPTPAIVFSRKHGLEFLLKEYDCPSKTRALKTIEESRRRLDREKQAVLPYKFFEMFASKKTKVLFLGKTCEDVDRTMKVFEENYGSAK